MMRHVLSFFISICIIFVLCSLVYLLLVAIVLLATLMRGFTILPGLLLALLSYLSFQRTQQLLRKKRITLATITRLTLNKQGQKSYQLQFHTRNDQTIHVELADRAGGLAERVRAFLHELYAVQPQYGKRFPLLYDINAPEKQPRQISFFTIWLGPLLLSWFAILLLLFGVAQWFA